MTTTPEFLNILLADDHEIFRKGLEVTLKRIPNVGKILHASDGNEVLSCIASKEPIHVVLMDIRMPVLNGIEATRQIRVHNHDIKIIGLSMMDDKPTIIQMFRAGANGYLLKNTNKQELWEAIQHVMNGNRYYAKEVSELLLKKELNSIPAPKKNKMATNLTARETEVLTLICHQYSTREIAEILFVAEKTIEGHRASLLEKTGSRNIAGLVYFALENGIIKSTDA